MTARADVVRRVDELAREHSGRAFADAIRTYADELDETAREELRGLLLERARGFDQGMMERVEARGWLRRRWDQAAGHRPAKSSRGGGHP